MAAIPYWMSGRISKTLILPQEFYWAATNVLVEANGLQLMLSSLDFESRGEWKVKIKSETIFFILNHIIFRTLKFDKVFEFVRIQDIIKGMPTICIPKCDLSPSTVKRTLSMLTGGGYLIKIKAKLNGSRLPTPMYGFHLPNVLKLVQIKWWNLIEDVDEINDPVDFHPTRKPSVLMLTSRARLKACIVFLKHYEWSFDFLEKYKEPIEDIKSFVELLREKKTKSDINEYSCLYESLRQCKKIRELNRAYKEYHEKFREEGGRFRYEDYLFE